MKKNFMWRESTRNRYVWDIVPGVWVSVSRNQSWKKLGLRWRVELFGNPHISNSVFEDLGEAQQHAETLARELIRRMFKAIS